MGSDFRSYREMPAKEQPQETSSNKENEASFLPEVMDWLEEEETLSPETYEIAEYAAGRILFQDAWEGVKDPETGIRTNPILKRRLYLMFVLFVVAVLWFGSTYFTYKLVVPPKSYTAEVEGRVTEVTVSRSENSRGESSGFSCYVSYSYTPENMKEPIESKTGYASSSLCSLSVGGSVPILYDPDNPHSSGIKNKGMSLERGLLAFTVVPATAFLFYSVATIPSLRQAIVGKRLVRNAPKKEYWSSEDKRLELEFRKKLTKALIQLRLYS